MLKKLSIGIAILLFLACAIGVSRKQMTEGEKLYRARCRSCHTLIDPKEYSDEKWKIMVEMYGKKSNLSEPEKIQILEYLLSNNEAN